MPSVIVAEIEVALGKEEEAASLLRACAEETRREPGNQAYTVCRSSKAANKFLVFELYADDDARRAHRSSDHVQKLIVGALQPIATSFEVETYVLVTQHPAS